MKVATIDDVAIFSNKKVGLITDKYIVFADGSSYDVATGEVVNRGPGYITLNEPSADDADSQVKTLGPETFDVTAVDLRDLTADVTVMVGTAVTVTVEGLSDNVDAVVKKVSGGRLALSGGTSRRSGASIHMGGLGGVNISGNVTNSQIITGGDLLIDGDLVGASDSIIILGDETRLRVLVTVPLGTEVTAEGVKGELTIGDTEGTVRITVKSSEKVELGRVGDVYFFASNQGEIDVQEVNGSIMVTCRNQSGIKIRGGRITALTAITAGQSRLRIKATAQDANLHAANQSEIDVDEVINHPVRNRSGQATIEVRNW